MIQEYNIFMFMQTNFNKYICDQLFGELSDHIYDKWIYCDQNLLNFLSMLDRDNKIIVLEWGYSSA